MTTTTVAKPVIATVRDGHYAVARRLVGTLRVIICACGFTSPTEQAEDFWRHMLAELGHRPQAVTFDLHTDDQTIVCTCGHQTSPVTDGTAWLLYRAHQDAPDAGPLVVVPEQGDAPAIEFDQFSADPDSYPYAAKIVSTTARAQLGSALVRSGRRAQVELGNDDEASTVLFHRDLIDAVRAGEVPGLQLDAGPAGDVLGIMPGGFAVPLVYRIF